VTQTLTALFQSVVAPIAKASEKPQFARQLRKLNAWLSRRQAR
jgi:hypothetical protein